MFLPDLTTFKKIFLFSNINLPGRAFIFLTKAAVPVPLAFSLVFIGFYQALLNLTGFYRIILGFTGFYWVLLGFTGIQLSFTGFYVVLRGFTWFYVVLRGLTGFDWV